MGHFAGILAALRPLAERNVATFLESVCGFALALVIGIPMAVCVPNCGFQSSLSDIDCHAVGAYGRRAGYSRLVWVGNQSKLAIAFLVAFFPSLWTATGLQATPPGLIELGRSLSITLANVLEGTVPSGASFVFSGARSR
jgi:ABC-type nitrate/sulfonate/bicarbonate transport system permease component